MLAYRVGRLLQILGIIDCGFALFLGLWLPPSAYAVELQVLGFAVVLFGAGRFLQKRGQAARRAGAQVPLPGGSGGEDR